MGPDAELRSERAARVDAMLETLSRFAPEYGPGFSNHAPMVVEAFEYLDLPELAERWVAANTGALEAAAPSPTVAGGELRLGDGNHAAWHAHFVELLAAAENVEEAVASAVDGLADGVAGAAGHGVLRTWHALRGWRRHPSAVRVAELAAGLGYWASSYRSAPAEPAEGDLEVLEVLAGITPLGSGQGTITDRFDLLDPAEVRRRCAAARLDPEPARAAAQLTEAAAASLRRGPGTTALLHAVTVADATENLCRLVAPGTARRLVVQCWGLFVSLYSIYGRPGAAPLGEPAATWEELVEVAAAAADPHAVKLVAAAVSAAGSVDTTVLRAALTEVLGPMHR